MSTNRISMNRADMERALIGHHVGSLIDPESIAEEAAMPILQAILLIFTTLTMALYILIITLVIANRRKKQILKGSFFRLVVSYFIADFIFYLEFTIFFRLRKYGYLSWLLAPGSAAYEYLPAISNTFHYYLKLVIYVGQVLFAANRLSSALFIMKYEHYWTNRFIWACRFGQFFLPILAILPICPLINDKFSAKYVKYSNSNTLRLETDNLSTAIIAYIDAGGSALANILCLGMYTATFIFLRREYKNHTAKQSVQNMELRLLGAALLMFVVLTLNTIIQILTIIANFGEVQSVMFVNEISYPIVDFMYSCQPWALLLTSSVVRARIIALFVKGDLRTTTHYPTSNGISTQL